MVNCRFIGILERRNLISYAQCAFRQDWFTVDHLLNLEHRVRFSSHAQTSCFRLRRGESVWHHLAIRHFEKLWLMESDRSTTAFSFCFSTGSLFLCLSWKCLSLVMLKEMRMTQGSLSSVMFAAAIEGMTHAFDLSVSASLYRPLLHFREYCHNKSAVTTCYKSPITLGWGEGFFPLLCNWDAVRTLLTIAGFTVSIICTSALALLCLFLRCSLVLHPENELSRERYLIFRP